MLVVILACAILFVVVAVAAVVVVAVVVAVAVAVEHDKKHSKYNVPPPPLQQLRCLQCTSIHRKKHQQQ